MNFNLTKLQAGFSSLTKLCRFIASRIQTDNILRVASSLSYTSLIALNSRLHGLHHVAKKSMMNGFPSLLRV